MNIADHRQKILFGIDEDRLIPAPKQRSVMMVDPVKLLGVDPIEMAHRSRQPSCRGREQEVVVGSHQAIGIEFHFPEPGNVGEQFEKALPTFVIKEDVTTELATVHDVVERAGVFDP